MPAATSAGNDATRSPSRTSSSSSSEVSVVSVIVRASIVIAFVALLCQSGYEPHSISSLVGRIGLGLGLGGRSLDTAHLRAVPASLVAEQLTAAALGDSLSNTNATRLRSIAIGYNTNLDLVLNAVDALRALGHHAPPSDCEPDRGSADLPIMTRNDLLCEFAAAFKAGIAAERFVDNGTLFESFVSELLLAHQQQQQQQQQPLAADDGATDTDGATTTTAAPEQSSRSFELSFHTGGNAALMANRLARDGVRVLLGGPVGPRLRSLLHHNVLPAAEVRSKRSNDAHRAADDGETSTDQIHLIMEYRKHQTWGDDGLQAPRANRFIVSHDKSNSHLEGMAVLHQHLECPSRKHHEHTAPAAATTTTTTTFDDLQALVVSGTHLCEALSDSERNSTLRRLGAHLQASLSKCPKVPIHLELAGVGDTSFLSHLAKSLFVHVDSIGLNEAELGDLYRATGGTALSKHAFHKLSVEDAIEAVRHVFSWSAALAADTKQQQQQHGATMRVRLLSRIHLHFLAFHMLAQRSSASITAFSPDAYQWSRERASASVAAGALSCTAQACGEGETLFDLPAIEQVDLLYANHVRGGGFSSVHLEPLAEKSVMLHAAVASEQLEFWVAPVLVCKKPIRTVGLGDTISSTALRYHYESP